MILFVLGCFGTLCDVLVRFRIIWDVLGPVRTFYYVLVHIGGDFGMFLVVSGRFGARGGGEVLGEKIGKSSQK